MNIYNILKKINLTTIIECGGHLGQDTKKLAEEFPKNTIHCIEANKELCDKHLLPLSKLFPNIRIYNLGLSNNNIQKIFWVDTDTRGDSGASSFLRANKNDGLGHLYDIEKPISVECVTLQKFIKDNNISNIDLLWLDVEQHEYEILENCVHLNVLKNIKYIYTEVNHRIFRENGKKYEDVFKLLDLNNFEELTKFEQCENWQSNVLFRNRLNST